MAKNKVVKNECVSEIKKIKLPRIRYKLDFDLIYGRTKCKKVSTK